MKLHQLSDLRHLIDQFVRAHSSFDRDSEILDFQPSLIHPSELIQFAERVKEISNEGH